MSILEKIETDLRDALKSGNEVKKSTLRMLKTDIITEKAKTGKDLPDDQILDILSRAAKRRKEASTEFIKAGRDDLSQRELDELPHIEAYLPKQLNEEEISVFIDNTISSIGSFTQKDIGRVMGEIMKELKGRADGNVVRALLQKKIAG
jgi:uncharacterized protein YqeY